MRCPVCFLLMPFSIEALIATDANEWHQYLHSDMMRRIASAGMHKAELHELS